VNFLGPLAPRVNAARHVVAPFTLLQGTDAGP
jgi:hypothetical protein